MQQQLPTLHDRALPLLRRLDRAFGEINVFLLALAIGIAALDVTCFITLRASAEIARANQNVILATPSLSPPT